MEQLNRLKEKYIFHEVDIIKTEPYNIRYNQGIIRLNLEIIKYNHNLQTVMRRVNKRSS